MLETTSLFEESPLMAQRGFATLGLAAPKDSVLLDTEAPIPSKGRLRALLHFVKRPASDFVGYGRCEVTQSGNNRVGSSPSFGREHGPRKRTSIRGVE